MINFEQLFYHLQEYDTLSKISFFQDRQIKWYHIGIHNIANLMRNQTLYGFNNNKQTNNVRNQPGRHRRKVLIPVISHIDRYSVPQYCKYIMYYYVGIENKFSNRRENHVCSPGFAVDITIGIIIKGFRVQFGFFHETQ